MTSLDHSAVLESVMNRLLELLVILKSSSMRIVLSAGRVFDDMENDITIIPAGFPFPTYQGEYVQVNETVSPILSSLRINSERMHDHATAEKPLFLHNFDASPSKILDILTSVRD